MKRIAMAIVAGTLSLSALAFGAKQANAAEFRDGQRVESRDNRGGDHRDYNRGRFHGRDFRARRFHHRRACE